MPGGMLMQEGDADEVEVDVVVVVIVVGDDIVESN